MRQTSFLLCAGLAGVLLLSSCATAPKWTHPSKPETAQKTDLRRCELEAERAALEARGQTRGDLAGRSFETNDPMALKDRQMTTRLFEARRDACMAALGYSRSTS